MNAAHSYWLWQFTASTERVTEVKTDIFVTSIGPVSDHDMVSHFKCHCFPPCAPILPPTSASNRPGHRGPSCGKMINQMIHLNCCCVNEMLVHFYNCTQHKCHLPACKYYWLWPFLREIRTMNLFSNLFEVKTGKKSVHKQQYITWSHVDEAHVWASWCLLSDWMMPSRLQELREAACPVHVTHCIMCKHDIKTVHIQAKILAWMMAF